MHTKQQIGQDYAFVIKNELPKNIFIGILLAICKLWIFLLSIINIFMEEKRLFRNHDRRQKWLPVTYVFKNCSVLYFIYVRYYYQLNCITYSFVLPWYLMMMMIVVLFMMQNGKTVFISLFNSENYIMHIGFTMLK